MSLLSHVIAQLKGSRIMQHRMHFIQSECHSPLNDSGRVSITHHSQQSVVMSCHQSALNGALHLKGSNAHTVDFPDIPLNIVHFWILDLTKGGHRNCCSTRTIG